MQKEVKTDKVTIHVNTVKEQLYFFSGMQIDGRTVCASYEFTGKDNIIALRDLLNEAYPVDNNDHTD